MNTAKPNYTPHVLLALVLVQLAVIGLLLIQVLNDDPTSTANEPANMVTVEVTREVVLVVTPTVVVPTAIPVELTFDDDPYLGSPDAPVKVVEFSDFQCSYCGRFYTTTLRPLLDHYGDLVQFVYRDYPVFGEPSILAGISAQCAYQQGKFWEYHNIIFDSVATQEASIDEATLLKWAGDLNLDVDEWQECVNGTAALEAVGLDFSAGQSWAITGTPTFFINGKKLVGAQRIEAFMSLIDQELVSMGITPPQSGG